MGKCIKCRKDNVSVVVNAKTSELERCIGMCQQCANQEVKKDVNEAGKNLGNFIGKLFS